MRRTLIGGDPTATSLPTAQDVHRGELRRLSGDGSTTTDRLYLGRNRAGTLEWAELATASAPTLTEPVLANTLETSGSNPAIAVGPALGGAGAAAAITFGNDIAGEIALTAGAAPATGVICTITFAAAKPDALYTVLLTPLSASAAALNWFCGTRTAATFTVDTTVTMLTAGNTPKWAYLVIEDV